MKILKRNEIGRTMVEMMGVISIISLLTVTSIGGYNVLNRNWKISKIEDGLLKMILVVEGGQAKTMDALDRFLDQALSGMTIETSRIDNCDQQDRRYQHCYRIEFSSLNENIVSYFIENESTKYDTNLQMSADDNLVIEFASSKELR